MLNKNYGYTFRRNQDRDEFEEAKTTALQQQETGYQSKWQNQIEDAMQKILNRENFQYDLNGDALYQQYKDQYVNQGKQAMMDTVGQASALTGGYGNSYAQTAGQQTYQGYLRGLNDKIPELYQLALDKYNSEGDELYNRYALFTDMDDKDFAKYQDREALKKWLATQDEDVRNYYLTYGRMPEEPEEGNSSGNSILDFFGSGSHGGSGSSSSSGSSLQDVAMAVIRGDYGNGEARKKALAAAGYDPAAVQAAVNKLIAGGALKDNGASESNTSGNSGVYEELSSIIPNLPTKSKAEALSVLREYLANGTITQKEYEKLFEQITGNKYKD